MLDAYLGIYTREGAPAFVGAPTFALKDGAAALSGDINGNSIVDTADYTVWRDTLGWVGTGLAADGNHNGSIDDGDYTV